MCDYSMLLCLVHKQVSKIQGLDLGALGPVAIWRVPGEDTECRGIRESSLEEVMWKVEPQEALRN